ncbi:hypothetical protein C8F04DRAFT_1303210 [Mycena alexandri]|uniref:Uncharacterized protein n=1 Tax=Mycena alexandri TaxID=1745969 RepID=A0AAD6SAK1_9AGAR|nr:hypothetical protein C8F04DRAFT_1303210 [Mycena alexandri]
MRARGKMTSRSLLAQQATQSRYVTRSPPASDSPPSFTALALYALSRQAYYFNLDCKLPRKRTPNCPRGKKTVQISGRRHAQGHAVGLMNRGGSASTKSKENRAYNPVRRSPATIKSSKSAGQQTECKRRTSSPKTFSFRDLPAGAGTYIQTDFQSFLDGIPPRTPSA